MGENRGTGEGEEGKLTESLLRSAIVLLAIIYGALLSRPLHVIESFLFHLTPTTTLQAKIIHHISELRRWGPEGTNHWPEVTQLRPSRVGGQTQGVLSANPTSVQDLSPRAPEARG